MIPALPISAIIAGGSDITLTSLKFPTVNEVALAIENLQLSGKTLTLLLDSKEYVLSTNANNRNISGETKLGYGYYLKFDIKCDGSNIKEFVVFQK